MRRCRHTDSALRRATSVRQRRAARAARAARQLTPGVDRRDGHAVRVRRVQRQVLDQRLQEIRRGGRAGSSHRWRSAASAGWNGGGGRAPCTERAVPFPLRLCRRAAVDPTIPVSTTPAREHKRCLSNAPPQAAAQPLSSLARRQALILLSPRPTTV